MAANRPCRPYRWLARYYDTIFAGVPPWTAAARRELLDPVLRHAQSGCDLACGTGTTALALAARGIQMYGVDISPEMCRLSREKARQAGLPLRVIRGDMRHFRLPEPVDLVTCEYDALNHLPRQGDLATAGAAVARALKPGGWFYFDVNTRASFEKCWPMTWWLEKPGVALVMHGGYDRAVPDRAWCDVEWFIREGRVWRRHREHVEEVCWPPRQIRETLARAGFDRVRAWDAAPFFKGDPLARPGIRTIYLARKATS